MSEKKNVFQKLWDGLSYQEKQPTGLSPTQVLERLMKILESLDDQQQAITERLTRFEHHMNVMHERQIAVLDKLNFMVRTEEGQLTHLIKEWDEPLNAPSRKEEQNP